MKTVWVTLKETRNSAGLHSVRDRRAKMRTCFLLAMALACLILRTEAAQHKIGYLKTAGDVYECKKEAIDGLEGGENKKRCQGFCERYVQPLSLSTLHVFRRHANVKILASPLVRILSACAFGVCVPPRVLAVRA